MIIKSLELPNMHFKLSLFCRPSIDCRIRRATIINEQGQNNYFGQQIIWDVRSLFNFPKACQTTETLYTIS